MQVGVETKDSGDLDDSHIEINGNWEEIEQYLKNTNITEEIFHEKWDWDWYYIKIVEGRTTEIWGEGGGSSEVTLVYLADDSAD